MTARRARGRFQRWLPNLAVAAASLAASLLAAELAVRWLSPQPIQVIAPGLYQPDPPRRYRLSPGYHGELTNVSDFRTSLVISSQGIRGDELETKAAGEKRLLVLGDSFVFGWGVEEHKTLAAQLERRLAVEHPGWRALNAGTPGFGLLDEIDWLETWGLALEPDAILLAVFLGNDLLDATAAFRQVEMVDGLVGEPGFRRGLRYQLYRRSHLVRMLKRAVPIGAQIRLRRLLGIPLPWSIASLREGLEIYAIKPTPLQQEGREVTRAQLVRLQAISRNHGLPLALVLLPDRRDVDPVLWSGTLAGLGLDPARYRPDQPARIFTELTAELGLPVLDLSVAFKSALARGERPYFEHDPHWTLEGTELAARETYPFVLGSGLVTDSLGPPVSR